MRFHTFKFIHLTQYLVRMICFYINTNIVQTSQQIKSFCEEKISDFQDECLGVSLMTQNMLKQQNIQTPYFY